MASHLNLPAELQHLIEKRESDDRRLDERREALDSEIPPDTATERRESERRTESPRRDSQS